MKAEQIKGRSIEQLKQEGIAYLESLPMLFDSEEVTLRSEEEIAKRFITSILVTTMCFEIQNNAKHENMEWFESMLEKFSIDKDFRTEKEKNILYNSPTEQDIINGIWKYESQYALFWILGLCEELSFPNTIAPTNKMIGFISSKKDLKDFLQSVNLRDKLELLQKADLYYRYHWTTTNNRINERENENGLDNSIVCERRAGLWWATFSHDVEISDRDNPDFNT